MKRYGFILPLLLMFIVGVFCSCSERQPQTGTVSKEEVQKKGVEALETTSAYLKEQKDIYLDELGKKLDEYDKQIDEIKKQTESQMTDDEKEKFQKKMEDLQNKRKELEDKIEKLKVAGKEAWQDLKPGIDEAVKDLDKSYDKALKEFQDNN
ncbi:MAG: hypothetical protein K8T10_17980 [Candidatus Eremiobacteraeota bacterium]|nr:hypothetical protein [Candidatus Eremiobacteraeota bacterium]